MTRMFVTKRSGDHEDVDFGKILKRIETLCNGLDNQFIDPVKISQKVIQGLFPGVTTSQLDDLAAETAAYMSTSHPDFSTLAARITVSNLHKNTSPSFVETVTRLHDYKHLGTSASLIADDVYETVLRFSEVLETIIDYSRDYDYDFFGIKTLERSYLLKIDNKIVERPQHMILRVAVGIHLDDMDAVLETYEFMSRKLFTHATPTLFNSGTPRPQLSSCFLLTVSDSIEGIFKSLKDCATISKYAGGIGFSIHDIRASGSYIRGTNGQSNGIVPMLRVFNDTARYVDQGGGKRKGSFAVYCEPWHADIFAWLNLRKNHGNELERARDLFYGLWVNDLFMRRVRDDKSWTLFCPSEVPGLVDAYGDEFDALYEGAEAAGKGRETIKARALWNAVLDAQVETGTPYLLYKDSVNRKSNQKNVGTIRSSNLCGEITLYTSPDEIAVCNLASINLSQMVIDEAFDFELLQRVAKHAIRNLDRVVDRNFYPVQEARNSNMRHRPLGLGVQGLADVFAKLRMPFESESAAKLNVEIFETIYYAAVTASVDLAEKLGPYSSWEGSPANQGLLQFDLWGVSPSDRHDWDALKARVKTHGMRNSMLIALMPTASTAQILGANEAFEPCTSNIYNRRVLAGEFAVINKYLLKDLIDRGLWTPSLRNAFMRDNGSVQSLDIPDDLKSLYKTVWEISQKTLIDMSAARGPYVCQTQSLNLFVAEPTVSKLTSMHFYSWKAGLKTGSYYIRTKPKASAIQFTVEQEPCESCSA